MILVNIVVEFATIHGQELWKKVNQVIPSEIKIGWKDHSEFGSTFAEVIGKHESDELKHVSMISGWLQYSISKSMASTTR